MVDYDAAVAAVQDPNADPVLLAKIAYENPEFGANVAVNPRCYPGLKRWLAEFGDERARETLAQIGFTADAIGGPVVDRETAESDNPQSSQTAYAGDTSSVETGAAGEEPSPDTQTQEVGPDAPEYSAEASSAQTPSAPAASESYAAADMASNAASYGGNNGAWTPADNQATANDAPQHEVYADLQSVSDLPADASAYGTDQSGAADVTGAAPTNDSYAAYAQTAAQPTATPVQPVFEEPVVTNPYGFTVQLALTTTDQMQIAQIAQYAPELRVCIARNPNTYPALLDWLAQLGDPAINAALASRQ